MTLDIKINKINISIKKINFKGKKIKILNEVSKNNLSIEKAYDMLYKTSVKKVKIKLARFIHLRFDLARSKFLSNFLNIVFFIPMPIGFIKLIFNKQLEDTIDFLCIKGILIDIKTDEANITIKTF